MRFKKSTHAFIFTVGHSTRSIEELIEILGEAGVRGVADVRRYPSSRRHPQFNRAAMESSLTAAGIRYDWLGEALGGRRREIVPVRDSPNAAWQVAGFRHYADAMQTRDFLAAIEQLEGLARARPTAFLCAERNWWSCHRRLIADFLLVRGWKVVHLLDRGKRQQHELTEFARVEDGRLTYPALV
jgi:uncharacterized protein (DUF488 family)